LPHRAAIKLRQAARVDGLRPGPARGPSLRSIVSRRIFGFGKFPIRFSEEDLSSGDLFRELPRTSITPPHRHISWQVLSSAGWPPTRTVGAPGTHGANVIGMQACGVNTPSAALVAAATSGLARLTHMPNGAILTNGS
jgi:hypothetical protein